MKPMRPCLKNSLEEETEALKEEKEDGSGNMVNKTSSVTFSDSVKECGKEKVGAEPTKESEPNSLEELVNDSPTPLQESTDKVECEVESKNEQNQTFLNENASKEEQMGTAQCHTEEFTLPDGITPAGSFSEDQTEATTSNDPQQARLSVGFPSVALLNEFGDDGYIEMENVIHKAQHHIDGIKFQPHNEPRLFVIWDNATGLELLRYVEVEKYLEEAKQDDETIVLEDPIVNQEDCACISVISKHVQECYHHTRETLFHDFAIPEGMAGYQRWYAEKNMEILKILEIPKYVSYRQLYYYKPIPVDQRNGFIKSFQEYMTLKRERDWQKKGDYESVETSTASHTFLGRAYPHHESSSTEIMQRFLEESNKRKEEKVVAKMELESLKKQEILYKKQRQHEKRRKMSRHIEVTEGPDPDPLPAPVKSGSTSYDGHIPKYFASLEGKTFLEEVEEQRKKDQLAKEIEEKLAREKRECDIKTGKDEDIPESQPPILPVEEEDEKQSSDSENDMENEVQVENKTSKVKLPGVGLAQVAQDSASNSASKVVELRNVGTSDSCESFTKMKMRRRSSFMNVAGEMRKVPLKPPKVITGSRPEEEENKHYKEVEEPVRRKVKISSILPAIEPNKGKVNTSVCKSKPTAPKLQSRGFLMTPGRINFGSVVEGFIYQKDVFLRNCGMELANFKVNRNKLPKCLEVRYPLGAVAAGLHVKLSVRYNPARDGSDFSKSCRVSHVVEIITETHNFKLPIVAARQQKEDNEEEGEPDKSDSIVQREEWRETSENTQSLPL